MKKLYLAPPLPRGRPSGGIERVLEAQARWLPEYDWQIVDSEQEADVVAVHAGVLVNTTRPLAVHNHGLYWTGDYEWSAEYWHYNADVIENLRRADVVTVPSAWVAHPLQRDMRLRPVIIPHGVNLEEWDVGENGGYVLWNKARVDVVADPAPLMELARLAPDVHFVTTYGRRAANIEVIGPQEFAAMRDRVREAGIYLSTCRETFGIGTLEAMACGIPVLGWDWGGNRDIVIHRQTGWLAPPGDYESLREGLYQCLIHRWEWGDAARRRIAEHYQWPGIIGRYAAIYDALLNPRQGPKVSVIVPTYNYAHFLPECLDSILGQDYSDFEVIVVDDGSTDNTPGVLAHYKDKDRRVHIIRQENRGLPAALNTGYLEARGEYCLNLDADNALLPGTLRTLAGALDADKSNDIVYGHFNIRRDDGNYYYNAEWPWENFSWEHQISHYNQIPSTCMMRRRVWERIGGYRERMDRNEDAEFWCRATSAGFRPQKVTKEATFIYRWHSGNKSNGEGGEYRDSRSWNHLCPWIDRPEATPFGAIGPAPRGSWPVYSHDAPHVSVCVACGPGHERFLPDALDSLAAQTFRPFEVVVANDTGQPLDVAAIGHPGARTINLPGRSGPARARNAAINAARAPLIWILDADDMAEPRALELMMAAWRQYPDGLVYTDCYTEDGDRERREWHAGPWSWEVISHKAIYSVSILYAKQWWEAVGGYPVDDLGWEDWRFGQLLHLAGMGATYVQFPGFIYRHWTGGQCGTDYQHKDTNLPRCHEWLERMIEKMGCSNCGGKGRSVKVPAGAQSPEPPKRNALAALDDAAKDEGGNVLIKFAGERMGAFSLNSRYVPRLKYIFDRDWIVPVDPRDAAWLLALPGYQVADVVQATPQIGLPRPPAIEHKAGLPVMPEQAVESAPPEWIMALEEIPEIPSVGIGPEPLPAPAPKRGRPKKKKAGNE